MTNEFSGILRVTSKTMCLTLSFVNEVTATFAKLHASLTSFLLLKKEFSSLKETLHVQKQKIASLKVLLHKMK